MFGRVAQSTTLILLAMLVVGDGIWRVNQQKITNQVELPGLIKNVQKNISNKNLSPDVLIVGSSLTYCFTYPVEGPATLDEITGEPKGNGSNCNSDPFMEKLLKQAHAPASGVFVMSMPGAMATDIYNVAESTFAGGKRPKVIVYTAAPRDFVDRLSARDQAAYVFKTAATTRGAQKQLSTFDQLKAKVEQAIPAEHTARFKRLLATPSAGSFVDFTVCLASQLYEHRSQFKNALIEFVCDQFQRDKDLWSAQRDARAVTKKMDHFQRDLSNYAARYKPPDFDRLKQETGGLRKLAAICAEHGTRLVVINMPLTTENKELLDPKLYAEYKRMLVAQAAAGPFELVDSDNFKPFVRREFLDSAHLNREGSKRLQELVVPQIAKAVSQK